MTRTMGIDLGTRKVTLAIIGPMVTMDQALMAHDTYESRSTIHDVQLHDCARYLHDSAVFYDVDRVWIEEAIIGNNRRYSLDLARMQGAVMAALSALRSRVDIRTIDNKLWKKLVVGNGNASKEQVRNYIECNYPPYALLCGARQDEYDAACIALAGIRLGETASEPGLLVGSDQPTDA